MKEGHTHSPHTHDREGAKQSAASPGQYPPSNDVLPSEAVAKVTKHGREEHVGHNEGSLEEAI